MGDDDAELQRLRRAAFSREATEDDRRRWAAFEAHRATTEPKAVRPADPIEGRVNAEVESSFDEDDLERSETDGASRSGSRRRLILAIGAGVLVGGLIGALTTVALREMVDGIPNWSGESSLVVFDRDPRPQDDPSGTETAIARLLADTAGGQTADAGELELRWIGAPGGFTTYAARWSNQASSRVCVVVTSALETASSCVPESDFARDGIRIMAFGLDLRWGPTGEELWANSSG